MNHLYTFLKGLAMGAADVVPGVSGGTIAFITGIYQRLLQALRNINFGLLSVFKHQGFKGVWQSVDANFLLVLLGGILTSVFSLAKALTWTLEHQANLLWAFFFGLVLSSALYVGKQIKNWTSTTILLFGLGTAAAYGISLLPIGQVNPSYPVIFLSGSIAICAMILPGISGSFILLLMGMYEPVLQAVKQKNLVFLGIFALGCGLGLLSFARLLSWTFKHYYFPTLALLTGFMLGSLNKVWPWQNVIQTRTNSKGELVPWLYENVAPTHYQGQAQVLACLCLMALGLSLVWILERLGQNKNV